MRRTILLSLPVLLAAMSHAIANPAPPPPQQPLAEVPFTRVRFHDQFWAPRLETNRTATIPHCFKMCETTGRIDNFAKAAGLMPGEFRGIFYDDSDVYKAVEGASYSLATHPDPALDKYLDDLIAKIAAAQRPDGYLNTYYTLKGGLDNRYTKLWEMHELYCAGHLFEAAVAHHRATGKTTLLNVATKFADEIATIFGPDKRHDVPGHEEIELALVKLSNETNNPKYRDLAQFFVATRGNPAGRPKLYGPYHQDHAPVTDQTTPTGHAVRQMYLLCGVTDLATSDPVYVPALDKMWHSLVDRRMYVTGGIGARHQGEAFGEDYELPNDTAYAETCAAIGNALWQHRMNLLHADAKYADTLERVLYNGMLSGVSLTGDRFFYVNPLSSTGHHHRQEWYGTACCPVNLVRFLPSLPGYVYATGPDAIYVNLYATSEATITLPPSPHLAAPLAGRVPSPGTPGEGQGERSVKIAQETRYPWDGLVALVVTPGHPATEFSLNLRVPDWCPEPRFMVNDKPVQVTTHSGYAQIRRQWGANDVVKLNLNLQPRRVHADPRVAADVGRVAIQYGPVVYCAEGVDHPGTRLSSLYLPADAPLTPEFRHDLLGGVTVIKARARALSADSKAPRDVDLTLVPYYAWDHRAPGEMTVWLAEDPAAAKPAPSPTLANTSTASASHVNPTDTLDALSDGAPIKDSADHSIPRFTWWDHRGTAEWVQYDFPKPTTVSSADVYFFDDTARGGHCRPPASWRLLYKVGDQWKPIDGTYSTAADAFNSVSFAPVTTTALRIEARLRPDYSAGILEWRVR